MVKPKKEKLESQGKKIGIVVSKFNDFITQRLLAGCLDELARNGIRTNNIAVIWVPGAYEISLAAGKLAKKKSIHTVICLGAVIRGETLHYDLVARAAAYGIMQVSLMTGKPVIFGVLAADTVEQANKRSRDKGDNKGRDAAVTALEMINVVRQIAGVK